MKTMSIDRRELLKAGLAASAAVALPSAARTDINFEPRPGAWRTFEVVTRMEIGKAERKPRLGSRCPRSMSRNGLDRSEVSGRPTAASLAHDALSGAEMLHVEWPDGEGNPVLEVTSRIATRDRATDFAKPGWPAPLAATKRESNLRAAPNSFLSTASSRKRPIR